MVSRWSRRGETVGFVAATAACGRQPSACRPTRFTSWSRRARPLFPLPKGTFRSRVRQHGVSIGLRRSCARPPKLPPASPFAPAENPVGCHGHHSMDMWMTPRCEVARQCSLAWLLLFQALRYLWAVSVGSEEFQKMVSKHCGVPLHLHRSPPEVVGRQPTLCLMYHRQLLLPRPFPGLKSWALR